MSAAKTPSGRQRWLVATSALGMIFVVQSRSLATVWHDNESFFTHQLNHLQTGPTRSKAHCVLAHLAAERGEVGPALDHYANAWEQSPVVAAANASGEHAELLLATRQYPAAIEMLSAARQFQPDRYRLDLYLASALVGAGRREDGFALAEGVLRLHPGEPEAYGFYASILMGERETVRASEVLRQGVERHPQHPALRAMLESVATPR